MQTELLTPEPINMFKVNYVESVVIFKYESEYRVSVAGFFKLLLLFKSDTGRVIEKIR